MKKRIILITGLIITVILVLIGTLFHFIKEAGVMDQIYRAAKAADFQVFNKVSALSDVSYEDLPQFENFGGLSIHYKEESLKKNFRVKLFFPTEEETIKIKSAVDISDSTTVIIYMGYNHKNQTITYEPISISYRINIDDPSEHYYDIHTISKFLQECNVTREDIAEYQEYILYDVVIKTWVDAQGGSYENAKRKMEDVNLINQTFEFTNE